METIDGENNYGPLQDVYVGLAIKTTLTKLLNEGDISERDYEKCILGAIQFYKESLKYVTTRYYW